KELRRPLSAPSGMGTPPSKRHWPRGLLFEGRAVGFTEHTVQQIIGGEKLCTPETAQELQSLQAVMEDCLAEIDKFSFGNIPAYQQEKKDELHVLGKAGEKLPDHITQSSREAISADFLSKQNALNEVLREITHEQVVPLAQPILRRFERIVD